MTYREYHCRRCNSHFCSLEAFDAHHEGSGESLRPCSFPDGIDFIETAGTCRISGPEPLVGVTVYRTLRPGQYGAELPMGGAADREGIEDQNGLEGRQAAEGGRKYPPPGGAARLGAHTP